jgi:DMSO/TMAO reductase YedYZ molybdopterin-dependent catalytic subunit
VVCFFKATYGRYRNTLPGRKRMHPAEQRPTDGRARDEYGRPGSPVDAQLQITGLVASPVVLHAIALATLPQVCVEEGIDCADSAVSERASWEGVCLADVVALGQPLPEARYVRVCAGEYAVPLSLEEARGVVLSTTRNGQLLTPDRGAPFRLVVPAGKCFTSVKWIDRLEVTAEPGPDDGERLARARRAARAVPGSVEQHSPTGG